jgi:hypothetical protein
MNGNSGSSWIDDIAAWYAAPFSQENNAFSWTLTLGLIILAAFFWQMILLHLVKLGDG